MSRLKSRRSTRSEASVATSGSSEVNLLLESDSVSSGGSFGVNRCSRPLSSRSRTVTSSVSGISDDVDGQEEETSEARAERRSRVRARGVRRSIVARQ